VVAFGVPQIHDYNPGVAPSGLFWTIRVPDSAVQTDSSAAIGRYAQDNVTVFDYLNVWTAFGGQPAGTAAVSFDVRWRAIGKAFKFSDAAKRFTGTYRMAQSTLEWRSAGSGFSFQSDPAKTSRTFFSSIGRERNGIFFS
jgi:hypothetical protein